MNLKIILIKIILPKKNIKIFVKKKVFIKIITFLNKICVVYKFNLETKFKYLNYKNYYFCDLK